MRCSINIMWFVLLPPNDLVSKLNLRKRFTAGWVNSLLNVLQKSDEINLKVVCCYPGLPKGHWVINGVEYFTIPLLVSSNKRSFRLTKSKAYCERKNLENCKNILSKTPIDIIHVHGSENFYGLLAKETTIPLVISMQGIAQACATYYTFFGKYNVGSLINLKKPRTILSAYGYIRSFINFKSVASRERLIIQQVNYFFGRTEWDKYFVTTQNINSMYMHVDEPLRDEFYRLKWNIDSVKRYQLFFGNMSLPRKGGDVLLEAVKLLKKKYDRISVVVANELGANPYLNGLLREFNKESIEVKLLGSLSAEQMGKQLSESHIFVSPTYIDNSSNSICEAQIVGIPVVATLVGGISSLIENGKTGLVFPAGDSYYLAMQIEKLFENDSIALELSRYSRKAAMKRHSKKNILKQISRAYTTILNSE